MGLKTHQIEIDKMVFGGDGMARLPDGRAVFIPFSLPGDKVRIRLTDERKNYARGWIEEILKPGPNRISPRCIHFGICGGCQYQHLEYTHQLLTKQAVFIEQIQRIAGIESPPVQPIIPSPEPWNYRGSIQLHLSPQGLPGYHASGTHNVVEIEECHLPQPGINAIWPQLDFEPGSPVHRIEIREGTDGEILVSLSGGDTPPEMQLDLPVSVVHLADEADLVMAGDGHILKQVNDFIFSVSAGSFFQVNDALVTELVEHLLANLELSLDMTLMDLYCGVGLFSPFLAPKVHSIIAVEQSESACQDFAINLDRYDNIQLYQGDVMDILPGLVVNPDIIVVDPPRTGLDRRVLDEIIRKAPRQLAYFSCDPPTLARDLKRLIHGGYDLKTCIPFDMFPQTGHIESLSILSLQTQ